MTDIRVTQGAVQVAYDHPAPDVRVTQGAVQVAYTPEPPDVRITQGAIQVAHSDTTPLLDPEVTGSVRDTSSALLALTEGDPDVRVTQGAMMVMYEPQAPIRNTYAPWLILAEFDADINVTQSATLVLADHVPCLTFWAQAWKITRTDGGVFAYTSHDKPLSFNGTPYTPCDSLAASAAESSTDAGSIGSQDLQGVLTDSGITEEDLFNGLFDGAEVEVWLVPWKNAGGEIPKRIIAGTTGDSKQGVLNFSAEVISPGANARQRPLLDVVTPQCRWKLGDTKCKVDLGALTVAGSVTATTTPVGPNSATRRSFTDSTRTEDAGYFAYGTLTFTSGANAGLPAEIKDYNNGTFVLWAPLIHRIQVGDTYTATPGCDKIDQTCKDKFSNFVNFGGFPDVPGQDALIKTPDAH